MFYQSGLDKQHDQKEKHYMNMIKREPRKMIIQSSCIQPKKKTQDKQALQIYP
jgi:hypothetical protein